MPVREVYLPEKYELQLLCWSYPTPPPRPALLETGLRTRMEAQGQITTGQGSMPALHGVRSGRDQRKRCFRMS
jgi:hypothetical protein